MECGLTSGRRASSIPVWRIEPLTIEKRSGCSVYSFNARLFRGTGTWLTDPRRLACAIPTPICTHSSVLVSTGYELAGQ
jgi:hypothetical protein